MFPQRLATFRPGLRTAGLLFSGAAIALVFALDRGPREPERPATASPPAVYTPGVGPPDMAALQKKIGAINNERLAAGTEAPDFTLPDAGGRAVKLSGFRGKRPVVLVFGSKGCDAFCEDLGAVRQFYLDYRGRAEFLFVYISEAFHSLTTPPPRAAEEAAKDLPWMYDGRDQRVEHLYDAWPRRLVVVGADGRVVLDAGHGPWRLDEIKEQLEAALAAGAKTSWRQAGP